MGFIFQYLKERKGLIGLWSFFVCIFAGTFFLYQLPLAAVLYPSLLCLLAGTLFFFRAAYQEAGKHKRLIQLRGLSAEALEDALEEGKTLKERDYQELIRRLCREKRQMEEKMTGSYKETMDYFTVWVHQIKTPIASMGLLLDGEDSAASRRLRCDLLHIEQYVEMAMTYLRLGAQAGDYVFQKVSLDKVIRENIRRFRGDFIMKKLRLDYTPIEEEAVSDEKWLSFVIGQILSNALKYTSEGSVTIRMKEPGLLEISDTGIGIAREDLPRIFEKGYTGGNGRRDKRASGLGLYLCREICGRLGHGVAVKSQAGKGTAVLLDLRQEREEKQEP